MPAAADAPATDDTMMIRPEPCRRMTGTDSLPAISFGTGREGKCFTM